MNLKEKKPNKKRRWLWVIGGFFLLIGLWILLTSRYQEEEKALRQQIRHKVKKTFPDQVAQFSQTFGLFEVTGDQGATSDIDRHRKTVVLIHGLDDPGKVWQNLSPELVKAGFHVWVMQYPNDQPIVESAHFFFDQLKDLKTRNINRIAIVAHSMGGLISREMLTRPDIDYYRSAEHGQVPEVKYAQVAKKRQVPDIAMLIMVGTPNHGSQLARFRVFGEIRDHLARMTTGETNWLGAILDGAGEAKIDLLPGSRF